MIDNNTELAQSRQSVCTTKEVKYDDNLPAKIIYPLQFLQAPAMVKPWNIITLTIDMYDRFYAVY